MLTSSLSYPIETLFAKRPKTAEQERIESLVARMEASVRRAFLQFVANVQSPEALKEIANLLGRGDIAGALVVVDRYIARLAPVLSEVFIAAARAEVAALAEQVRNWAPAVGISFDPSNDRAAALMRDAQLDLIRELGASQREAIRQALSQGLLDGAGPREMGTAFRNAIGLTASQEAHVRNYERLLRDGSAEALDRQLRDRRFDPTVSRAADGGKPLTGDQIGRMVDRYRQRYVAYRAETIARTETARVVGAARQEGVRQTLDDTGIDASLVERVWRATRDRRTRHTHAIMDGQAVGLDEAFTSPSGAKLRYPGDPQAPGSETVMCRCLVVNRIKRPKRNAE
jgi:hypothetical protein